MSKEDIEKNIEKLTSGSSKKDKIIRPDKVGVKDEDKVGDKVGSSALHADVSGSETSPIIPSVFPQEMEKPIGFFEEEIYMRLVTRFSSLQKLINTVKNILRLTTRLLHSYNTQYNDRIAFLILAASSQNIFKRKREYSSNEVSYFNQSQRQEPYQVVNKSLSYFSRRKISDSPLIHNDLF